MNIGDSGECLRRFVRKSRDGHLGYANQLIFELNQNNPSKGAQNLFCYGGMNMAGRQAPYRHTLLYATDTGKACILMNPYFKILSQPHLDTIHGDCRS